MLLLLLLLFLYHKRVKQFFNTCLIPTLAIVLAYGLGRVALSVYNWISVRRIKVRVRVRVRDKVEVKIRNRVRDQC
jgi:hypothetical protein